MNAAPRSYEDARNGGDDEKANDEVLDVAYEAIGGVAYVPLDAGYAGWYLPGKGPRQMEHLPERMRQARPPVVGAREPVSLRRVPGAFLESMVRRQIVERLVPPAHWREMVQNLPRLAGVKRSQAESVMWVHH